MKLNWVKIILATVVIAVVAFIWNWLTCGWLFTWVYTTIQPTNVWKPFSLMPTLITSIIVDIIIAFILVIVYAIIESGVPGKNLACKGLWYGFLVWLVGVVPGDILLGLYSVIAPGVILYWLLAGIVILPIKGLIIALVYGKE